MKDAPPDVVLVGAGIMSATLGVFLKELNPDLKIELFEVLEEAGLESSNAWNNAGTGHAANCELNYTPQRIDGTIDIAKALEVNTQFDISRQFWAYLVKKGAIAHPQAFIHSVPHMSFVRGGPNTAFLRKRFEAMQAHHCYRGMEYTEDRSQLLHWAPLLMEGRCAKEKVAATRMMTGTDVDYGALTRLLFEYLGRLGGVSSHFSHEIVDIRRGKDGLWHLKASDLKRNASRFTRAKFVFLGAGGKTLLLLQKANIPEIRGYAGFPVSGEWLRCDNPSIASRHQAKVYGKASVGSPPMSVPHLDTRIVEGKRSLLFGPYAGFSPKFLKNGSLLDFFRSVEWNNVGSLWAVARDNMPLTKYLMGQVFQSAAHRMAMLREFYPLANQKDWSLEIAGQRVQIIKPDMQRGAVLQFGTELVASADRSLIGLLGASPGASTAASIATDLLERCFAAELPGWLPKLKEIVPSYGESLIDNGALCQKVRASTAAILNL